MYCSEHGGDCCGRGHIVGFDRDITEKLIERELRSCQGMLQEDDYTGHFCIEAVLTKGQKNLHHKKLIKLGFKEVWSFVNPNSGNTCYVYLINVEGE